MRTFLVACAILGGLFGAVDHAQAATPQHHLHACQSDEGESPFPCVWFAPGMGNHRGHSFRIYRDGRVKQISDDRALQLLGDHHGMPSAVTTNI